MLRMDGGRITKFLMLLIAKKSIKTDGVKKE